MGAATKIKKNQLRESGVPSTQRQHGGGRSSRLEVDDATNNFPSEVLKATKANQLFQKHSPNVSTISTNFQLFENTSDRKDEIARAATRRDNNNIKT